MGKERCRHIYSSEFADYPMLNGRAMHKQYGSCEQLPPHQNLAMTNMLFIRTMIYVCLT